MELSDRIDSFDDLLDQGWTSCLDDDPEVHHRHHHLLNQHHHNEAAKAAANLPYQPHVAQQDSISASIQGSQYRAKSICSIRNARSLTKPELTDYHHFRPSSDSTGWMTTIKMVLAVLSIISLVALAISIACLCLVLLRSDSPSDPKVAPFVIFTMEKNDYNPDFSCPSGKVEFNNVTHHFDSMKEGRYGTVMEAPYAGWYEFSLEMHIKRTNRTNVCKVELLLGKNIAAVKDVPIVDYRQEALLSWNMIRYLQVNDSIEINLFSQCTSLVSCSSRKPIILMGRSLHIANDPA